MKLEDAIFLLGKKTLELELMTVAASQNKQFALQWIQQEQDKHYTQDVEQFAHYINSLGCE